MHILLSGFTESMDIPRSKLLTRLWDENMVHKTLLIAMRTVEELNERSEEQEKQRKDEWKERREELVMPDSAWMCNVGRYVFGAQGKAGLVSHWRQNHGPQTGVEL